MGVEFTVYLLYCGAAEKGRLRTRRGKMASKHLVDNKKTVLS